MGMVREADQSSVVLGGSCSDGLGFVIVREFTPTTFLDYPTYRNSVSIPTSMHN
jgi:hypothetical protein